jgi:uncharacterized RDD family membrane protein YckC
LSTSPSTALPNIAPPNAGIPNVETAAAWKQEVNDRLAAHRTRRNRRGDDHPTLPGLDTTDADGPLKSSIAAKVAARYAKAPTYSEMLAAEAQNAASAAAVAAKAASQAHAAAQAILTGLDLRNEDLRDESTESRMTSQRQPAMTPRRPAQGRSEGAPDAGLETKSESRRDVRSEARSETRREPWQDAHPAVAESHATEFRNVATNHEQPMAAGADLRITLGDQGHAHAAVEHDPVPQTIAANLIEFPRELFATRRARPRLAEGPLREDPGQESGRPQLRIFEVEAESISTVATVEQSQTEWASIRLGAHPVDEISEREAIRAPGEQRSATANSHAAVVNHLELPLQTANLEDRTMAAVVDLIVVTAAFLVFVLAFVACSTVPPMGKPALMAAVAAYFVMAMGYQLLFFAFAESTPGMRYAKIALCTFDDENPTRKQMRIRVATMLLSLCPLGLGCAWVFFDEDHLSWHDRITRTYQRSYR